MNLHRTESCCRGTTPLWSEQIVRRRHSDLASELCQEDAKASCYTKDEGRSLGAALWEEASNSHKLLRLRAVVVNVMVKRRDIDRVMYGLERRVQTNLR